jgi:hypothetical protein
MANRQQRRAAAAQARKTAISISMGDGDTTPVPDDIKTDIAKVVRSIDWTITGWGGPGGLCFFRAFSGLLTLQKLGIAAKPTLGGMVYRAGPDPRRDVVAFCGEGNIGRRKGLNLLAHWFVVSSDDIIDFSVGDWKENPKLLPDDGAELGPVQWTAPSLPEFFWAPFEQFQPSPSAFTPDLGRAWYTGFAGEPPDWNTLFADAASIMKSVVPHINSTISFYALKERLYAVRNGHTAIRLSDIYKLLGVSHVSDRDQLIVLRGKVDLTEKIAREILAERVDLIT